MAEIIRLDPTKNILTCLSLPDGRTQIETPSGIDHLSEWPSKADFRRGMTMGEVMVDEVMTMFHNLHNRDIVE